MVYRNGTSSDLASAWYQIHRLQECIGQSIFCTGLWGWHVNVTSSDQVYIAGFQIHWLQEWIGQSIFWKGNFADGICDLKWSGRLVQGIKSIGCKSSKFPAKVILQMAYLKWPQVTWLVSACIRSIGCKSTYSIWSVSFLWRSFCRWQIWIWPQVTLGIILFKDKASELVKLSAIKIMYYRAASLQ
jgi:hypothetical protein